MNWGKPEFLKLLWLLLVVGGLLWYCERIWRKRLLQLTGRNLQRLLPGKSSRYLQLIRASLLFIAVALIMTSAGQPRWGFDWSEVRYSGVDIVIAVDVSKSMDAQDAVPSRLKQAQRKVSDLLRMLRGDRVGIVAFAGTAFVQCPLTVDYDAVRLFLSLLDSDLIPVGGSAIAEAIEVSVRSLTDGGANNSRSKAVIVMSDGEDFGGELDAAIKLANENKIGIFTLGIGGESGAPIPLSDGGFKKDSNGNMVLTKLQSEALHRLAEETGGAYAVTTPGDEDLIAIYANPLRNQGDSVAGEDRQKIWHERFQWLLFPALMLLMFEMLIPPLFRFRKTRSGDSQVRVLSLLCLLAMSCGILFSTAAVAQSTDSKTNSSADLFNQGVEEFKSGKFQEAEKSFSAAARSENAEIRAKALYNLGHARAQLGKYQDSAAAFDEVLSIDSDNVRARENRDYVKELKEQEPPPQENQNKKDEKSEENSENSEQKESENHSKDQESKESKSKKSDQANDRQEKNEGKNAEQPDQKKDSKQDRQDGENEKNGNDSEQKTAEQPVPTPQPEKSGESGEVTEVNPTPGPSEGGEQEAQPAVAGQISAQQAEQVLRSVDDKITKYLYRPDGADPKQNKDRNKGKDW